MVIELTSLHFIFSIILGLIILALIIKMDTTLISVIGIFALGCVATGSIFEGIRSIFNGFGYAIIELAPTILVISIIVAMSKVLERTGIIDVIVIPFTKLMRNADISFWIIGIVMMVISLFFWPSPASALIGVIMLPIALKAGLPAIGVAVAMNIFGHGIALSGDFVIQGAPKLTADAAGLPVSEVVNASVPLVIVMGVVTSLVAFYMLKRDMKTKKLVVETKEIVVEKTGSSLTKWQKRFFAIGIPSVYLMDVVAMSCFKLQGGDATALIGGTTVFILIALALAMDGYKGINELTYYIVEGLKFGITVFGPVIPIAAFFYLGDSGFSQIVGNYLPQTSAGIVNDLGAAIANAVPLNGVVAATTLTTVGAVTGLDGSGFSGISLAGSIAKLFSYAIGGGAATLTSLGQISAIWVGGGTLIPWALIVVAGICKVNPFELARRNLIPVVTGLVVTTIVAIFLI